MRTITEKQITTAVAKAVYDAALELRPDVLKALKASIRKESSKKAKETLKVIVKNAEMAKANKIPICQDTGMTVVYCEIGRDLRIKGNCEKAINAGVKQATKKGYLRRSVVSDPVLRENTGTNTPVLIHYSFCAGTKLKISVLLKGFGCENKGQVVMLNPTADVDMIEQEVVRIIKEAGSNACPPFVIGVGIGGTMDKAVSMAKEVLLEVLGKRNRVTWAARLERSIIKKANASKIGALGLGGKTTVLDVKVKTFPTHIAGLPVAVNVSCHALRSKSVII